MTSPCLYNKRVTFHRNAAGVTDGGGQDVDVQVVLQEVRCSIAPIVFRSEREFSEFAFTDMRVNFRIGTPEDISSLRLDDVGTDDDGREYVVKFVEPASRLKQWRAYCYSKSTT